MDTVPRNTSLIAAPSSGSRPHWSTSLLLFSVVFLLTRHAQLAGLQSLIAPAALLIVLIGLRGGASISPLLPIALYLSLSMFYGAATGNDAADVIRFFLIFFSTLLCLNVKPRRVSPLVCIAPVGFQALVIVGLSLFLAIAQSPTASLAVRSAVLANDWGDVYSHDGIYFRSQLRGNALIPLIFFLALWSDDSRKLRKVGIAFGFAALVAAGNLTYFISAATAVIIRYRVALFGSRTRILLMAAAITVGGFITSTVLSEVLSRKFEGSDSSMGVRFDQIDALAEAYADRPSLLIVGAGLGSRYPDGKERPYSKFQYIELQALYLVYQIGLVGAALYTITLVCLVRSRMSKTGQTIFWLFMLSGATNPYIFDSNQIVASMLLVHMFPNGRRQQSANGGQSTAPVSQTS